MERKVENIRQWKGRQNVVIEKGDCLERANVCALEMGRVSDSTPCRCQSTQLGRRL